MEGMYCANSVMIVQMSQLRQIEHLKDEVCVLKEKIVAQDDVISNLVSNNLNHF